MKEYSIDKGQAVKDFEAWANSTTQPLQMCFAAPDIVTLVRKGLGELLRSVGKTFMESVMEAEVDQLVGPRSAPDAERQAYRWGTEDGFCVIDGQRVPVRRPRVRSKANQELALGSYELFQRGVLVDDTVWGNIMRGLTMRHYKEVVQQFVDAYGIEKSTVSEHFVAASRNKLEVLLTRSLKDLPIRVVILDGTVFKGEHMLVAIGVDTFGRKIVLGIRQGASENAAVAAQLLEEIASRGLSFEVPRLYLVDGSKALRRAVLRLAGDAAFIQRCQVHKIRNVTEHVTEEQRPAIKFRMRAAYAHHNAADAKRMLYRLHDELMDLNPSAAASLAEGLEETLTVIDLQLHSTLRSSLSSTNAIESCFSVADTICRQVKRWQGSDHRLRWVASAIMYVESRWNRVKGYRQMPMLIKALDGAFTLRQRSAAKAMGRSAAA